jgi:hypothetical protein
VVHYVVLVNICIKKQLNSTYMKYLPSGFCPVSHGLKSCNGLKVHLSFRMSEKKENNDRLRFGWGKFRPDCLQCLNGPKCFMVFLVIFSMMQGKVLRHTSKTWLTASGASQRLVWTPTCGDLCWLAVTFNTLKFLFARTRDSLEWYKRKLPQVTTSKLALTCVSSRLNGT